MRRIRSRILTHLNGRARSARASNKQEMLDSQHRQSKSREDKTSFNFPTHPTPHMSWMAGYAGDATIDLDPRSIDGNSPKGKEETSEIES